MVRHLQRCAPVLLVAALAAPASAGAQQVTTQKPPKLPSSTAGTRSCGESSRNGATFRVHVTKGSLSCRKARAVVRKSRPFDIKGWVYFDWTKGGNGPWTDVYATRSGKTVIGAIMRG